MREGWKEVTLGEIIEIKHGYGFKGEYFTEEETTNVLVTPGNFNIGGGFKNDKLKFYNGPINENFVLKENDVVVTMTDLSKMADTIGYSAKIPKCTDKIYLHNQRIGLVNLLDDSCDLNFIYWLLRTNNYQRYIAGSAIGATVKHTSPSKIYTAKVKIPIHKETQSKIASILSGYDDLIEKNLKRIKLLEEMAQQTYEEWFVRMRFPDYETEVFGYDGLPEGWDKVKCFDAMEVLSGGTPKTDVAEYWNGGIEFFTPKDAKSGSYTNGTEKTVTELGVKKCNSKLYPKDTVFITARGTVGKLNLASKPMIMNQSCYALKGKNGITQFFLFCAMNAIIETFKSASNGGVFNTIIVDTFKFLDFVTPKRSLILKFEDIVKPIYNSILNLQSQNQCLREARDILLPRLMMGMIDTSTNSVQSLETLESKSPDAKIIPLEQPKKEVSKEFKEGVLIAFLTERFGSEKYPLGRKRYTKLSYLFHRYSDNKIQDYLRKAAGPYNPKTKYGGPEKIALTSKYIKDWKGEKGTIGFVTAEKIEDAKKYFSNYWQIADLDWLTSEFKFKSNDELELLATVDNSLMELSKKKMEFTSANVLDIIKSEKEWEAKLERTIFSDANVERAIGFLTETLQYEK